jgi:hypothetical protein
MVSADAQEARDQGVRLLCDGAIVFAFATGIPAGMEHAPGGFFEVMDGPAMVAAAGFFSAREKRATIRH